MSAITTGRGKWVTWEPKTTFGGDKVAADTFPKAIVYSAWAADQNYDINTVVKTGASPNEKYWKCRVSHTSGTGAGKIGQPTADNRHWREIPMFTVIALQDWNVTRSTSQQTVPDLSEDQDPSISTEITGDMNLTFSNLWDDLVQQTFEPGTQGTCKIYEAGIGTGKPVREFDGDVSSVGLGGGSGALSVPVTIRMDGPMVRSTQA